jgi:hypothetical protein
MKPYPPSEFAATAARLPQGLADAVHADLGESTTQYLSDAAAAADGAGVVAALKADGVRITAARMQGTSLVVTVPSRSDVAAVAATGAVAQVGTSAPDPYSDLRVRAASAVLGGEPYGYATGPTSAEACSIGFNGYALPGGASEFATAGHCMEGQTGATTVQEIGTGAERRRHLRRDHRGERSLVLRVRERLRHRPHPGQQQRADTGPGDHDLGRRSGLAPVRAAGRDRRDAGDRRSADLQVRRADGLDVRFGARGRPGGGRHGRRGR